MTSPSSLPTRAPLFSRLPRRTGPRDALVVLALLGLCGAFVAEILPVEPAADRLYALEADRDFYARAAAARAERLARAEAARPLVVAARTPRGAPAPVRPAGLEAGAARDAGAAAGARRGCVLR